MVLAVLEKYLCDGVSVVSRNSKSVVISVIVGFVENIYSNTVDVRKNSA